MPTQAWAWHPTSFVRKLAANEILARAEDFVRGE
jgi:hypothetical protein